MPKHLSVVHPFVSEGDRIDSISACVTHVCIYVLLCTFTHTHAYLRQQVTQAEIKSISGTTTLYILYSILDAESTAHTECNKFLEVQVSHTAGSQKNYLVIRQRHFLLKIPNVLI